MITSGLDDQLRAAVGRDVPGVALVVVGPEGTRARSAVGMADLRSETPMTTSTVMPWFSMTKIATVTAAIGLAGRGHLDLDEPVSPLVPAMGVLQPEARARAVTPRHLMQHTAGLANPIPVRWVHPADQPGPEPHEFLVRSLARHRELRSDPGTRSSYSNLGTLVLGAAMATVVGDRFETVLQDTLLSPLRMTSTGFTYLKRRPAAVGYHARSSPMRLLLPRWVVGAPSGHWLALHPFLLDGAPYGGLVGSADDAARLVQLHLRDGQIDGRQVLAPDAAVEMRRITARGRRFDLGLGWFVPADCRDAQPPLVEHLGGGAGFHTLMRLYPSAGVGAVVMGNSTRFDADAVASLALGYR